MPKFHHNAAAFAVLTCAVAFAASTTSGAAAAPALVEYRIAPSATDPEINTFDDDHFAYYDPTIEHSGLLFVFLPGSFGRPENTTGVCREAAARGMHAIGLRYPNAWTVNALCDGSGDADCYGAVRLEIFDGTDRTALVGVDRPDSIENRLTKLLLYLAAAHPTDGWEQYLLDSEVRWDAVVVAGHSQGGGHAGIIGKIHPVARVVMYAAPNDVDADTSTLASWLSWPGATPPERYYGFSHARDSAEARRVQWRALGMDAFGAPVNVDGAQPPYAGSRQLYTQAEPAVEGEFHGSVAVDRNTPLGIDGSPVFAPVWGFLAATGVPAPDRDAPAVSGVVFSPKKVKRARQDTVTITWTSGDASGTAACDVLYASDGVTFDAVLAAGLPGDVRTFSWTTTGDAVKTKSGRFKIVVRDGAGNAGEAVSDRAIKVR